MQDSFKTLAYVDVLQETHSSCKTLQVLVRNKFLVLYGTFVKLSLYDKLVKQFQSYANSCSVGFEDKLI